jgi:serine protease Do
VPDSGGEAPGAEKQGGADAQVFELEGWGLGLRALGKKERRAFGRSEGGVFLAYVAGDGTAGEAGVPRDAVLTAVDGAAVGSVEDALRTLQVASASGDPALLRVRRRDGTTAFYEVEPPR